MFNLTVWANPARMKREFLNTQELDAQAMPPELAREFEQLKQESPEIQRSGSFWWDFVQAYRGLISLLVLGRGLMTVLVLFAVLASQRILDASNSLTIAVSLLCTYALIILMRSVINARTAEVQGQLLVCTRTFVTLRMNAKLLKMGQLSSDDFSTGNLKTLISSDIYRIADLFQSVARNGVPCVLGLLILGPVIVYSMGVPGVIAMVVGFGAMPLAFLLGKYVHMKEDQIKTEEDTLSTIIGEWVSNVRLLRFLGWENLMRRKVASHVRRLMIVATQQYGVNLINFGVSVSWWLLPIITLIWANQWWSEFSGAAGAQPAGLVDIFASIWMLNHITLYIRWLPNIFIDYASASACVKRLEKLFAHADITDDLLADCPQAVEFAKPVAVHFRQVSFSYVMKNKDKQGKDMVLRDINLSLDLQAQISLIGKVGAGKSTLLKLLCAEIKPTQGHIDVEFDNGVIADLWHENVYRRFRTVIGYMPQEAYLSNTSLGINIALASNESTGDIMQAIRMAELEADMAHWESGLHEEVGETGVNLSGGQKQRVNLARALFSGRPYLVLDDPLSAVDATTEASLMENLKAIPEGFLLSSHRLNELTQTQRLLVLDGGQIIEDGDPIALMSDPASEFSQHLMAGDFGLIDKQTGNDNEDDHEDDHVDARDERAGGVQT
ncbi:MAG: ATP-binding cassette subfamily C (CFTR/MRP) protein 1 [Candidatus Azotimanducaceae bacterium]|jgi:ATP-binding cassette subfamily C (CFTR/MRP) protein 1